MTTDAIYEECGSDWSHQVFVVETTRWLQHDQTLPLSAKGVACETNLNSMAQKWKCSRFKGRISPVEEYMCPEVINGVIL